MAISFPYTFANLNGTQPGSTLDANFTYITTLAANANGASTLGGTEPIMSVQSGAAVAMTPAQIGAYVAGAGLTFSMAGLTVSGKTVAYSDLSNVTLGHPLITGGSINGAPIGQTTPAAGAFTAFSMNLPTTVTGTTYTVAATDSTVIFNLTAACTVTLPTPASFIGRVLIFKGIAAYAVASASSNVVPLAGGSAGTAILSGSTPPHFAMLQSDGTYWQVLMGA